MIIKYQLLLDAVLIFSSACIINANASSDIGYDVMQGFHCGGTSIKKWEDGSTTNYGQVYGLSNCESICSSHTDCAGFVHYPDYDGCGYWKTAPLMPYSKSYSNCHKKIYAACPICAPCNAPLTESSTTPTLMTTRITDKITGSTVFDGLCRYGSNKMKFLKSFDTSSSNECEGRCVDTRSCVAFAYVINTDNPANIDCLLYSGGPYTYGNGRSNTKCTILKLPLKNDVFAKSRGTSLS